MQLPIRLNLNDDESIESYLIRLALSNGYTVKQLIDLYFNKNAYLSNINLYHSKLSSKNKLLFLRQLSECTGTGFNKLYEASIFKSFNKVSNDLTVLLYKGIEIPSSFFRKESIPICPLCLKESRYVRQLWHLGIIICCPIHKSILIRSCPKCGKGIHYIANALIDRCPCGVDLTEIDIKTLSKDIEYSFLEITQFICNSFFNHNIKDKLFNITSNVHSIFGLVVFFCRYIAEKHTDLLEIGNDKKLLSLLRFIMEWPESYHKFLKHNFSKKIKYLIKPINETAFSFIFNNLLQEAKSLPDNTFTNNLVLLETFVFIQNNIGNDLGKDNKSALGKLLLNKVEAAILLGTSTKEVARLTAEGYLTNKLKTLNAYSPCYQLSQVFGVWITHFQNRNTNMFYYLSRI